MQTATQQVKLLVDFIFRGVKMNLRKSAPLNAISRTPVLEWAGRGMIRDVRKESEARRELLDGHAPELLDVCAVLVFFLGCVWLA